MFLNFFRRIGVEITVRKYPVYESFEYYLRKLAIETVLDVGANEGQFATELRANGFTGRIISFEPLPAAYKILQRKSLGDDKWECYNFALGDQNVKATLRVSKDTVFSSLLDASPAAHQLGYGVNVVSSEEVEVRTLQEIWGSLGCSTSQVLLKIDTQGSDFAVLHGAMECLSHITAIRLELPLRPMYHGQKAIDAFLPVMRDRGFHLVDLAKVCRVEATGELLEMDGLFVRRPASPNVC